MPYEGLILESETIFSMMSFGDLLLFLATTRLVSDSYLVELTIKMQAGQEQCAAHSRIDECQNPPVQRRMAQGNAQRYHKNNEDVALG